MRPLALIALASLLSLACPACTPEARAPIEKTTETVLTAEQAACLVDQRYDTGATRTEAALACGIAEAIGEAFLASLEAADGKTFTPVGDGGTQ
jgi:hypothetical protein